jgi:hypothetical protein
VANDDVIVLKLDRCFFDVLIGRKIEKISDEPTADQQLPTLIIVVGIRELTSSS